MQHFVSVHITREDSLPAMIKWMDICGVNGKVFAYYTRSAATSNACDAVG